MITNFKVVDGFFGFFFTIHRISTIKIGDEVKQILSLYNVHNHDENCFYESYISPIENKIHDKIAHALNYQLSKITVGDLLAKVNISCNSINNKAIFSDELEETEEIDFSILSEVFILKNIWFEHEAEFVFNNQIKINTFIDYHFDDNNYITIEDERIKSISLMRTKRVDGVEVEDVIVDEYFQVSKNGKLYSISSNRIPRFLDGFFFGRNYNDNLFFANETVNYEQIKKDFFNKLGISYIDERK